MWPSKLISVRIVVLFIATSVTVLVTRNSIRAQTNTVEPRPAQSVAAHLREKSQPSEVRANEGESEVRDRMNALEESLRIQNAKLETMEKIIAEQQRMIEVLTGKTPSVAPANAASAEPLVNATSAAQTPSLEDRIKKVEGQVAKVGPFRLSGDFRLRFDSILRKAENHPPAGFAALTHQQNIRARYRFRLNLDTDVNDKLKFHGQLTTGPANNPLTNDQDFGQTTTRHLFSINEAWIEYQPTKAINLQGGRVQEVFADNSTISV